MVDLEQVERLHRNGVRDVAGVAHLREVSYPAKDAVRDPRSAARTACDLAAPSGVDAHIEEAGRSLDDALDLGGLVVVEPVSDAEAVAERRGQKPGARCRPDERERLQ